MKNKKLGILAVLVMLVAVSFNAVGGTYAKYISAYSMTDEARVAKWNFTDEAIREVDLFRNSYTTTTTDAGDEVALHNYVASSDAWKVIAPGTSGMYEYNVKGTAETNYKVTPILEISNNVKLDNGYDPLQFSVDGETWMSSDEFNDEYKTDGTHEVYPANAELVVTGKIYWQWLFATGNDNFDTELGEHGEDHVITAKIGVVVEQTQDPATVTPDDGKVYATPHASVTNRLTADQLVEATRDWGYKAENANITFNGKEVKGTLKAYNATDYVKTQFGVSEATNYFYALNVTVPAGYNLINPTAYEGETAKGVVINNLEGTKPKSDFLIINVKAADEDGNIPVFQYGLVNAAGVKTIYTINYDLNLE